MMSHCMSLSELRILILLTVQKKARLDEEGCGDRLTRAEHFASETNTGTLSERGENSGSSTVDRM